MQAGNASLEPSAWCGLSPVAQLVRCFSSTLHSPVGPTLHSFHPCVCSSSFLPLQILAMIKDLTHNVPKLIYAFNSYLVRDCHGHNGARQTLLIPHSALSPGRERDIYAIIIQISTDCVMVPCRGWWWVAVVEPVGACTWAPGWASVPRLWIWPGWKGRGSQGHLSCSPGLGWSLKYKQTLTRHIGGEGVYYSKRGCAKALGQGNMVCLRNPQ